MAIDDEVFRHYAGFVLGPGLLFRQMESALRLQDVQFALALLLPGAREMSTPRTAGTPRSAPRAARRARAPWGRAAERGLALTCPSWGLIHPT